VSFIRYFILLPLLLVFSATILAVELDPEKWTPRDEDLRILKMRVEQYQLEDVLPTYQRKNYLLVPLGYLSEILDLAINADIGTGIAQGFVFNEERTFYLDTSRNEVTLNGISHPYKKQLVFVLDDDIYVDSSLLSKWFNITINVDLLSAAVTIKSEDKADYIALGRALVADPDIIGKYLGQVQGQILPCLACSEGCLGGVKSGQGLGCVVNPLVGVDKLNCKEASVSKAIAIVGGGLAGMEAAITLKKRGHSSVIFEKEKLGGQFNLAWLPPGKSSLKELVDYYEEEIEYWNIPVEYKAFTVEDAQGFDEVIVATGAEPIAPKIEGLKKYYWTEFLHDNQLPENERVMIVGGGLIGLEVASKLVEKNNEVIIVEMLNEVARGMEMLEKKLTMAKLKKFGARIYTGRKVVKVEDDKVTLHADEDMIIDKVDKIVMATGMKSVNALYNELKDKAICHVVGDAQKVGKAIDAIHEAYLLACKI